MANRLMDALSRLGPGIPDRPATSLDRSSESTRASVHAIDAARIAVDAIDPAALADLVDLGAYPLEPLPTSGDHLRLPQLTRHTGPEIRAAIDRMLAVDTSAAAVLEAEVVKEARMLRVLRALRDTGDYIHLRGQLIG